MKKYFVALSAVAMILAPAYATAHFGSFSLERRSGPYLVDIGYDVQQFLAGEPVIFNFALVKNPGTLQWEYEPYDAVEAIITDEDRGVINERMPVTPPSLAFLQHEFPASGTYSFQARYFSGSTLLADGTFSIVVRSKTLAVASNLLAAIPIAAFLIALCATVILLRKKRTEP